jgi:hypothetical protein
MKKQFRIAHLAFALCLSATAAAQSVASCAISSGVMTCTVSTTNDTVDSTGLPANAASLRDAIIQVNSVAPPPAGQTHIINCLRVLLARRLGSRYSNSCRRFGTT